MNQIDELIRSIGADTPAADHTEHDAIDAARRSLRAAIAAEQGGRGAHNRRRRLIALAAALVSAVVLSTAAFGVGQDIVSWLAGAKDVDAPVPTASDVVVASGEAGVPWRIVATASDQGLCLFLVIEVSGERGGSGGCGYRDIRGDLPPDLRGDPASKCLATPTTVVPCGSLPRHWMSAPGSGWDMQGGLERTFARGLLAEGVASVELVLTDGKTVRAHVVERPDGLPLNFYWAAFPCPLRPYREGLQECAGEGGPAIKMTIARDADGQVLERRVPVWNGNPTGDPNGPAPPTPLSETP
jgi:hypothetical protein